MEFQLETILEYNPPRVWGKESYRIRSEYLYTYLNREEDFKVVIRSWSKEVAEEKLIELIPTASIISTYY